MSIVLGANQYGKAENRVVRIYRDTDRDTRSVTSTSPPPCAGTSAPPTWPATRLQVLPTDTQKQTVYAYAKEVGVGEIEDYRAGPRPALRQRHRAGARAAGSRSTSTPGSGSASATAHGARPHLGAQGPGDPDHDPDHRRRPKGDGGQAETLVSGFKDLVVLKSTGSEFHDFLVDEYTTLIPTNDRIMATSLVARWRYLGTESTGAPATPSIKQIMLEQFAEVQSLALQQTLYEMGRAVLEAHDEVAEIKFSAPNKHHFVYDLSPFGLENPNEVFHADDRPYGLIEATVLRDDAPPRAGLGHLPGFAEDHAPSVGSEDRRLDDQASPRSDFRMTARWEAGSRFERARGRQRPDHHRGGVRRHQRRRPGGVLHRPRRGRGQPDHRRRCRPGRAMITRDGGSTAPAAWSRRGSSTPTTTSTSG